MDFHSLKRKQLQSLCKSHGIPANKTNHEMAELLTAALQVNANSIPEDHRNEVASEDEQKITKKVRFSPDIETREYEPSGYKKPARRTRRTVKLASSSLKETEKSVLPNEVANKRGKGNGQIGSVSRTTSSLARVNKEIEIDKGNEGCQNDPQVQDHLVGPTTTEFQKRVVPGDIDRDSGQARKGSRRLTRNRAKTTDPELIKDGVANRDSDEARYDARRSARNVAKFADSELVKDRIADVDVGETTKGARRSARNVANFTDLKLVNHGAVNMDGVEVKKAARRSARDVAKYTDPELVNDGVANMDGDEVRKGARRSTRNEAKTTDSELVNAGVVNRIMRCKAQSVVSISAAEGKSKVCGTTSKESSEDIATTVLKRKSIVQFDVPVEGRQLVPKESRKRRKTMDLDVVPEVKTASETSEGIEKAQPPAAYPHRSRRKTIMLNSNIVPEESALNDAAGKLKPFTEKGTGKKKCAEQGLRRSNRRESMYVGATPFEVNKITEGIAEVKEISESNQKAETTVVVTESLVVKPSSLPARYAPKMKQKAIAGVSAMTTETALSTPFEATELIIAEAAGGNNHSIMQSHTVLKDSKKRGKSKNKPRGKRNVDCVDVSALNSHAGVEIDSGTNLLETMSSKHASNSKEESTSKVPGEYTVVTENVVINTGNSISDGCINGGEDDQCPSSAKCVTLANITETLNADGSDNVNEHILLDTSSFSVEGGAHDQCQSSKKRADLVAEEEMFNVEENLISNGIFEGDANDQRLSYEKFANSDGVEGTMTVARGSAVVNENNTPYTGKLISGGHIEYGSLDQCQSSKKRANSENEEDTPKVAVESAVINEDNAPHADDLILDGGVQVGAHEEDTPKVAPDTGNLTSGGHIEYGSLDQFQSSKRCANSENEEETPKVPEESIFINEADVSDISYSIENKFVPEDGRSLQSVNVEIITESNKDLLQEINDVNSRSTEVGRSIEEDGVVSGLEWNEKDGRVDDEEHGQEAHQWKASLAIGSETNMENTEDVCDGANERFNEIQSNYIEQDEVGGLEKKIGHDELTDEVQHVRDKDSSSSNVQEMAVAILHEAISSCGKLAVSLPAGISSNADSSCRKREVKLHNSFSHQKGKAPYEEFDGEIESDEVLTSNNGIVEKSGEDANNCTDNPSTGADARNRDEVAIELVNKVATNEGVLIYKAGSVNKLSCGHEAKIQPMEAGKEQCLHELDDKIVNVANSEETADTKNLDTVAPFKGKTNVAVDDYESEAFELNLLFESGECAVEKPVVEEMKKIDVWDQPHALTASAVNQDGDENNCELKLLSPKETYSCAENDTNDVHANSLSFSVMKMTSTSGLIQMAPQKNVELYDMMEQKKESLTVGAENIVADTEDECTGGNGQVNVILRNDMEKDRVSGLGRIDHVESTDEVQLEVEPPNCKYSFQVDSKASLHFEKDDIQDAQGKESVSLGRYVCHISSEVTGSNSKAELEDEKGIFQIVQEGMAVNRDPHDFVTGVALTCAETTRFRFNGEENDVSEGARRDALAHFFMGELEDGKATYIAAPKNSSDKICEKDLGDSMICDHNVGEPFLLEALDAPSSLELPDDEINKCEDTSMKIQVESTFFTDLEINLIHGGAEHGQFVHEDLSDDNMICKDLKREMHLEQGHIEKCELPLEDNFKSEGSGCAELTEDKAVSIEIQDMQFGKATKATGDVFTINQGFIDLQDDKDNKPANSFFSAHGRVSVESYTLNIGHNDSLDESTAMHGPHIPKEQTDISYQGIGENEAYETDKDSRAAKGKVNTVEEAENGGSVPSIFSDETSHEMAGTILHKTISSSSLLVVNQQEEISSSADSECDKPEKELHHAFTQPKGYSSYEELDGHMEDGKFIVGDDGRVQKCGEDANNPTYTPSEKVHGEDANEKLNVPSDALSEGDFIDNTGLPNPLSRENRTMIESMEDRREPCLQELDDEAVTVANSKQMSDTIDLDAPPIKGETTDSVGDSPCYENEALFELDLLFQEGESVVENPGADGSATNLLSEDAGKLPANATLELFSTQVAEEPSNLKQGHAGITESEAFELNLFFEEGECVNEKAGVASSTNLMSIDAGNFPESAITNLSSARGNEDPNNWGQGHTSNFIVQEQLEEIQQLEEMPDTGAMMVNQSHTFSTSLDNEDVTVGKGNICELKMGSPPDTSSCPETEKLNSLEREPLSSVMKKTSRTGLLYSAPPKVVDMNAMKENAPNVKMEQLASLSAVRMPPKRRPLQDLKKQ